MPDAAAARESTTPGGVRRRWAGDLRWFAWRPVRLTQTHGRWAWLRTVNRTCWWVQYGDYGHKEHTYALLP